VAVRRRRDTTAPRATLPSRGLKGWSVVVDVEGRRGYRRRAGRRGPGAAVRGGRADEGERHGGKQKPDFNTPSHPYGITSLAEYNQDL
jgi:hypothetical protein